MDFVKLFSELVVNCKYQDSGQIQEKEDFLNIHLAENPEIEVCTASI